LELIGIAEATRCLVGYCVNTFANSRTAFASLRASVQPTRSRFRPALSIGHAPHLERALSDARHLLFIPPESEGACFIGFRDRRSRSALLRSDRGGKSLRIADIGSDLMNIRLQHQGRRRAHPGVIADCTGDNAGDSVGPSADVSRLASPASRPSSFILLAVKIRPFRPSSWCGSS